MEEKGFFRFCCGHEKEVTVISSKTVWNPADPFDIIFNAFKHGDKIMSRDKCKDCSRLEVN